MKLGESGLVFVEMSELSCIHFKHVLTSLDEDYCIHRPSDCGRVAAITGCTEWLSETAPCLTVGWDWVVDERSGGERAWRLGLPRTNINLVGNDGRPLPWEENLATLGQRLETLLPWQEAVCALAVQSTKPGAVQEITREDSEIILQTY